jgi:hypothetical protein
MEINKNYKIIDNFLDKNIFLDIKNFIESPNFNWFLQKKINENHDENDLTSYFTHIFFCEQNDIFKISNSFNLIIPILTKINMKKLIRIKSPR